MTSSNTNASVPPPGFGTNGKSEPPSEANKNRNLIDEEARRLQDAATRAQTQAAQHAPTDKLNTADQRAIPEVLRSAYGYDIGDAERFTPLPKMLAAVQKHHDLKMWFWRIEFEGIAPGKGPIGIDLFSDAVIGRDPAPDEIVDIDLGTYEAFDKGVSRRHALLRPTRNRLYIIDLDSTNGTRVNSLIVGQGRAMEIHSGDTITLGRLSFTVKVLLTPEQTAPRGEPLAEQQDVPLSLTAQPFQKLPENPATAQLDDEKKSTEDKPIPPASQSDLPDRSDPAEKPAP